MGMHAWSVFFLLHLSLPTQSRTMSGGGGGGSGGCNILRMCCKKKKKTNDVSIEIEDKAAMGMDSHSHGHGHAPVGKDLSFREMTGAPCNNCSLISMGEAVPNTFGRCHQGRASLSGSGSNLGLVWVI